MTTKIICVVNDTVKEDSNLHSEHGLSFWIQTEKGVVLLGTGQTAAVLSHNLKVLDLLPQHIDMLVLSHAHYDHTGRLEAILSRSTNLTLFAHPDIFRPRYSLRQGEYRSIGSAYEQFSLSQRVKLNLRYRYLMDIRSFRLYISLCTAIDSQINSSIIFVCDFLAHRKKTGKNGPKAGRIRFY